MRSAATSEVVNQKGSTTSEVVNQKGRRYF
jgi:hypothetical protein